MKSIFPNKPDRWYTLLCTFVLGLLLSQQVWAVDLGTPTIRSFLGQPLDVRISVVDGTDENMQGALVSLAPVSEWVRSGINLLPDGLTLQVSFVKEEEEIFVALSSQEAVREPVLQVLLNFQVTGQELSSKPFILFLDPRPQSGNRPRNISSRAVFNRQQQRAEQAQQVRETPPQPAVTTPHPTVRDNRVDLDGNRYGPVREGETLWSIAERISREVDFTPQQILLALQQANPNALEDPDNVNTLRSGVTLTLPSTDTLARTDAEQALALIEEQNRQWQASGRGARLELLRGGEDVRLGVSGGGDNVLALRLSRMEEELMATRRENEALREQVGQLEQTLSDREAEISLSNSTLADIQQQLEDERNRQSGELAASDELTEPGQSADGDLQDSSIAGLDEGDSLDDLSNSNDEPTSDNLFAQDTDSQVADSQGFDSNTQPGTSFTDDASAENAADSNSTNAGPVAANSSAAGTTGPRWSWPIWESAGWQDLERAYPWLPKGQTGFTLSVFVLVLIIALPLILWLLLRGNRDKAPADSAELLDRLVTQSASRRASLQAQREAAQSQADSEAQEDMPEADDSVQEQQSDDASDEIESPVDDPAEQIDDEQPEAFDAEAVFGSENLDEEPESAFTRADEPELKPEIVEGIDWTSESEADSGQNDNAASQPVSDFDDQTEFSDEQSQEDSGETMLKPFTLPDAAAFDQDTAAEDAAGDDQPDSEYENDEHQLEDQQEDIVLTLAEEELDDDQDLEAALDEVLGDDLSDELEIQPEELLNDGDEQQAEAEQQSVELDEDQDLQLDDLELDDDLVGDLAEDDSTEQSQLRDSLLVPNDSDRAWSQRREANEQPESAGENELPPFDSSENDDQLDDQLEDLELDDSLTDDLQLEDISPAAVDEVEPVAEQSSDSEIQNSSADSSADVEIEPAAGLDDPFAGSMGGDELSPENPESADEPVQSSLYGDDSIDVKLDLARAYLAMGDREAMLTILDEIGDAGSEQQRDEVQSMRDQLSN